MSTDPHSQDVKLHDRYVGTRLDEHDNINQREKELREREAQAAKADAEIKARESARPAVKGDQSPIDRFKNLWS